MSRRLLMHLLGAAFGCALLGGPLGSTALAQRPPRPPRQQQPSGTPGRTDSSPFRRIDLDDLRVDLLALNDDACPLQIQSGRAVAGVGGHRVISVDVRSLAPTTLDSLGLGALVFDAAGVFKWSRDAGTGAGLATGKRGSVDLALDYSTLATGDRVVVAVKEVAWAGGGWASDWKEVRMVATEIVKQRR